MYQLSRKAEDDLLHIYAEGLRLFGFAQAERYQDKLEGGVELLSNHPYLARQRPEFSPPVRIYPCGSHIIVYSVEDENNILIIRVRHQREDWFDNPA